MIWATLKLSSLFLLIAAVDTGSSTDIFQYANKLTGLIILVAIAVGAYRGWWVPGWRYREIKEERDKLLDLALASTEVGHRALSTAEKVIEK